jgi:multidrug resistance efflux pump
MLNNPVTFDERVNRSLADMAKLRRFTGTPSEFWPAFLGSAAGITGATKGLLILKDAKQEGAWKKLGEWGDGTHADRTSMNFTRVLVELGDRAIRDGNAIQPLEQSATPDLMHYALAVKLALNRPEENCVATVLLANATEKQAHEALLRLQLVSDTPFSYLVNSTAGAAKADVEKFAVSLDVLSLLNAEKKFLGAGLAICNAAATRYNSDRVSLGWIEKGYIRLKSMSRTERFDKNMAAVKALELTMEECLDQDDEIIFPQPEGTTFVSRDHEKFAKEHSSGNMVSVPIRVDNAAVAVLTFERASKPFTAAEIQQFRLLCDQAARRLSDLKQRDGWVGVRMVRATKAQCAKVVGPEHTWAKVLAVLGFVALVVLFFVPFNYRVEGNFLLRSDNVAFLTTPFDGYIKAVNAKPGDTVRGAGILLQMNTDELELSHSEALADRVRYEREAEKARATNGLAEMRIALSLRDQSNARIKLLEHRLEQAAIKAPFDSIVVEGDLRERIGAPIKQGDALFKLSKMDGLYIEAEINQRDVHEFKEGAIATIAFVTQPRLKYPAKVERIYPAAFPKEGENIFIVRSALQGKPDNWWRPGMSGLVKVEAGKRSLAWILTHRTVDFLRMVLWW